VNEGETPTVLEEARWFGPPEGRLFGWLMWPDAQAARGGVILAQPLGREARAARRAMRSLGIELAKKGFVALRLDYPGTGDSSGSLDDVSVEHTLVDSIRETAAYLQSFGLTDVSAVGMRLGATILASANAKDLTLSSLVLWDPCETGRSFLRELSALEALRRADFEAPSDGSVVTSEWIFGPTSVEQIRGLDLLQAASGIHADRLLIITRDDRAFPERLRRSLEGRFAEWETSSEQSAMLDVEHLKAVLASGAINRIATWLDESAAQAAPFKVGVADASALVCGRSGDPIIRETFVRLGRRRLFGIVSEPVGESRGPLIVFLNTAKAEHVGTSRLWVDLSRGWSGAGMRCVRFDLTGIGDSPRLPRQTAHVWYEQEWPEDVEDVLREMQPLDPANVVLIGLCSGAYLAAEGALAFGARGACLVNPPIGNDLLHAEATFRKSRFQWVRFMAKLLNNLHLKDPWLGTGVWEVVRIFLPRRYSEDLIATVAKGNTTLLVLGTADDLSPYRVPLLRSIDRHRVVDPRNYQVEFVPGLDHAMHVAEGRALTAASLDRFVRNLNVVVTPSNASET
jgi:alpha-beta hydrolase superfamily lysophospholipase